MWVKRPRVKITTRLNKNFNYTGIHNKNVSDPKSVLFTQNFSQDSNKKEYIVVFIGELAIVYNNCYSLFFFFLNATVVVTFSPVFNWYVLFCFLILGPVLYNHKNILYIRTTYSYDMAARLAGGGDCVSIHW